jgi:hypothetical protein
MEANQEISEEPQIEVFAADCAPAMENTDLDGTDIIDQPVHLTQRLATQIKSSLDYATLKASETRSFVEKQVTDVVEVGQDIAKKADEIPVVHQTTSYVYFVLHTTVSYFLATLNFIKNTVVSTKTRVTTAVTDTTTMATQSVKARVLSYSQMVYDNVRAAAALFAFIAQKLLPTPVYDLGSGFINDPVSTTRQQLPPKVVELGDSVVSVGIKYYGIAKGMTDKTKSNIDAVRNEAVKKAHEAKDIAMQTIGFARKTKEE